MRGTCLYSAITVWFGCLLPPSSGFGNIYCGDDNCYELLRVNRNDDISKIRKSYRQLAREFHPDRQKSLEAKKAAEARLQKLNIAYEILMDDNERRDYDDMLDNPDRMYFHYYRYYRRRYTHHVDVRIVVAAIVIICSIVQYIGHWTSYNQALSYLVRDPKHRAVAREIAVGEGLLSVRKKNDGTRFTREELKNREEEILRNIISSTVDLRGDCSKPCIQRLFIVRLLLFPVAFIRWSQWMCRWIWKYWIRRMPYDEDAQSYITRRRLAMSQAQWDGLDDEHRDWFMRKRLWIAENHKAYMDEVAEQARLQAAENSSHKRYRRYLKKTGGVNQFSMDDFEF